MTIFERLELIRAGYKRTEIDAMIKADEEAAKAPEQPKDEPKQEEPKQDEVIRLRQELEQLRKDMQLKNVQSIGLNTNPDVPVEQVLAEAVFGNQPMKKE